MVDLPTDLDAAADLLYAEPPDDFVARRDALSKAVRAAGDRDLATAVKGLRRPTVAAWAVNAAVAEAVDGVAELLGLGERLRDAQAALDGVRLKELDRERQAVEEQVLDGVRRLVRGREQALTGPAETEVRATLRAAAADAQAASAVASGHLTRALSYAGFGEVDLEGATATPVSAQVRRRPRTEPVADELAPRRAEKRQRAEQAAEQKAAEREAAQEEAVRQKAAEQRAAQEKAAANQKAAELESLRQQLQQAHEAETAAREAREVATTRAQEASALVEDLHARLQQAREELTAATKAAEHAERTHQRAERARRAAERQLARSE